MKMYYKPLDITQLSGSPWNTAEKVLGLDQDDKVIMAEPEETVTPEYVDEAIDQAMEAETARTEDTYAKKSEVPDLDDYYTKEEVDEAISGITVDLTDYYTKDETNQAISSATQDLASTDYVDDAIAAIPEPDLSDYYTKGETDGAISTALVPYATKGWVSSQSYANQNYVMFKVNEAMQIETARTESTYAKPSDIPSLDGYATEEYVDDAIADIPQVDLSEYAKTTAVTQDIQTAMAAETARTESTYLKEHQSLDNYYTKSEVDAEFVSAATAVGNAIDAAVDGLASETYVNNAVDGLASEDYVNDAVTSATEGLASEEYVDNAVAGIDFPDDYATTGDVASAVEGLASESYVDDAISTATEHMVTTDDLQDYATEQYVDGAVTDLAQSIGMLGMVNDVTESNGTVTVQKTVMQDGQIVTGSTTSFNIATPGDIQTAIASETARTESTYLKEHQSLDNYYTKSEVDAEITGATADLATTAYVLDAVSNLETAVVDEFAAETARTESTYAKPSQIPSLAGYATETYVDNAIASETARTESTYLKEHQDISGKLDKTDFNTYTGATETVLAGKLDASAYTVDNAFDSASTNPVENRAIYEAFYGVTTELVVSSQSSGQYITWQSEDWSTNGTLFLYTTNSSHIYVAKPKEWAGNIKIMPSEFNLSSGIYGIANVDYQDPLVLGETYQLGRAGTYPLLDLTTEGETYIVLDTSNNTVLFSKTLPSTHIPSDLIPNAQDGSDTKQFVYNDDNNANHRVVSKVYLGTGYQVRNVGKRVPSAGVYPDYYSWTNQEASGSTVGISAGSEVARGIKTLRDSVIIGRAEEALSGMTETVTLTLGTQPGSQYRIFVDGASYSYLYATNNPRYYAFPLSNITATDGTYWELRDFYIGGTRYYISNPLVLNDSNVNTNGKYQLYQGTSSMGYHCVQNDSASKYVIVDTELLTIEITDSLTFTRTKSVQEMIGNIPAPDMSNYWTSAQTQSAITAATQGMVTSGDVATQIGTAMASETARTESTYAKPSQIPSLNGYATEAWVGQQGYLTSQSLTNYYTKTEIDGMIGDIESLLASI